MSHLSSSQRPRFRRCHTLLLLCSLALGLSPLWASEADRQQQRQLFMETKQALETKDLTLFNTNLGRLQNYPLYPYLIYWQLRAELEHQDNTAIQGYLDTYSELPTSSLLRGSWLRHLAKVSNWQDFLQFYRGGGTTMQCYLHTAQLRTGEKKKAWDGAKKLWLIDHSQADACDELFDAWEAAGGITQELRWQRIEKVMARGRNPSLALHLAEGLDKAGQEQLKLWHRVHNDPTLIEHSKQLKADTLTNRRIIVHGLKRLARKESEQAIALWGKLNTRYKFSTEHHNAVTRAIARHLAYDGDHRALLWFARLPDNELSQSERTWAVRLSLLHKKWRAALAWLDALPVSERQSPRWQYWRARITQAMGDERQAEHLYYTASGDRGYYGFLAADRIRSDYNLEHKPVEVSDADLEAVRQLPGMVRARELYALDLVTDARREWRRAVSRMNRQQRLVAGKLADDWQWHNAALITLARANYFSDLDIRFPLAHRETVSREAESRSLDPAWVYAVARQESAMSPDARSSAGAMGLMQLMPSTGRAVAKKLNLRINDITQLLEPATNIHLGTAYLRQVLDRFDNNPVLATAAYNAGPHRVSRWFPQGESVDADIWVENIPFRETRKYVRRVMAYTVFYDQRIDNRIIRLHERMPLVGETAQHKSL